MNKKTAREMTKKYIETLDKKVRAGEWISITQARRLIYNVFLSVPEIEEIGDEEE